MKTKKILITEPVNIADDFYIGNTHIQISDDLCGNMTKKDVDKILGRIEEITFDKLPESAYEEKIYTRA